MEAPTSPSKAADGRACPACAGTRTRTMLRLGLLGPGGPSLPLMRCPDCGHRFLSTSPEEQARIEASYDDEYVGFRADPFFARRIREEIQRVVAPRVPAGGRILDVGCGNGEFLAAATERGYRVEGIDISEAAARFCEGRGVPARAADFLSAPFEGRFDLVTLWDVVEHLRDPAEFLVRARGLLAPGGSVLIKTPGFGPLSYPPIRLFPRLARTVLGAPGHVQYYTRGSLEALLRRCGLERVDWLGPVALHSVPATRSLKRRAGRLVGRMVARTARNGNLYTAASPAAGGT